MFQAILGALKGLGGGFTKGIGSSLGLEFAKDIPNVMAMKSPVTGMISQVAAKPVTSIWKQLGTMLGAKALTSQAPSLPGSDIDIPLASQTSVQQSRGYQGRGKKSQLETLLSQLARR